MGKTGLLTSAVLMLWAGTAGALPECDFPSRDLPSRPRHVAKAIDAAMFSLANRDYDGAQRVLDAEVQKSTDDTDALLWLYDALGSTYLMRGQPAEAARVLDGARNLPGLNAAGRYAVSKKLAAAQAALGQNKATIATLESVQQQVCAPLEHAPAYDLAAAYLAEQRVLDAEKTLAPHLAASDRNGRNLDWGIQCAVGRVRACTERFLRAESLKELNPAQAAWFDKLLPALRATGKVSDLLDQARAQGWIDPQGKVVASAPAGQPAPDELIPIFRVSAAYPKDAVRNRIEGFVVLEVTVNPDGSVRDVAVRKSAPPHTFEQSALDAVRRWRFQPKIVSGMPVEAKGIQTMNFTMAEEAK